jgi:hypothetical protein
LVPLFVLAFLCTAAHATKEKDAPKDQGETALILFWPNQENAILKVAFGRFQNMGGYGGQMTLLSTVIVQNVSTRLVPKGTFTVTLLDKERVRAGSGILAIDDLNAGDWIRL